MTLHDELFKILVDFGEFAREQDMALQPTNSIHPTISKISALFQQELHTAIEEERKVNKKALKEASEKLRKLRLTTVHHIKDDGLTPSETVKSVFKSGLGGLYDDKAIEYVLQFGLKYYFESLAKYSPSDKETTE